MSQWQWDAVRREYYYYSPQENAYVYGSGVRVVITETNQHVGPTETQEYVLFMILYVSLSCVIDRRPPAKEPTSRIAARELVSSQTTALSTHNLREARPKKS
jgi:hypothetical protein